MSSGAPSHLRAALRLLMEGVRRARSDRGPPLLAPRRKVAVERGAIVVDPRRVARYLAVTEGARIAALKGEGAPLPPTYPALWETALTLELLAQHGGPLPLRGMIHRESELVAIRPLRVGDPIRTRLEVERADPHRQGVLLTVQGRHWNGAGQLCQETRFGVLLRTPDGGEDAPGPAERKEELDLAGEEWREVASWTLGAGHGRRYARVSGDFNPIHLWRWSSRLLGYDRPILHGYCTQAVVAHTLIERQWGGDATALRRLRIRFRSPLSLPCRVRLLCTAPSGGDGGRFRVIDALDAPDARPYAEGEFVGG